MPTVPAGTSDFRTSPDSLPFIVRSTVVSKFWGIPLEPRQNVKSALFIFSVASSVRPTVLMPQWHAVRLPMVRLATPRWLRGIGGLAGTYACNRTASRLAHARAFDP
jgi:hypothetical protein